MTQTCILRRWAACTIAALGLFLAHSARAELNSKPAPPNILVILTDDLGINDLSCYGRKDQATPNLDKLAAQGIRFTSAYCAQSICSPSRAALMTGIHPASLHLTTFLPGRPDTPSQLMLNAKMNSALPKEIETIATRLKGVGYATGLVGKWHLGESAGDRPTDRGFDHYYAGKAVAEPTSEEGGKGEFDLTAHAETFIEEHKAKPFFLIVSHNTPHIPLRAKPDLVEQHKGAFNPTYAAMMQSMDDAVGRLMKKLEDLKIDGNTLVIFTSDNGGLHVLEGGNSPPTHNTPFRAGKGFLYEGGLRVPLIMRLPGVIAAGSTSNERVINGDLSHTIAEAAGVPGIWGKPYDGVSLLKWLKAGVGQQPAAEISNRTLFWHFPHYTNQGSRPAGAIREGDWKLIEDYDFGGAQLFNLKDDPGEAKDLSMKEPNRTADLRGKLAAWRIEVAANDVTPNPDARFGLWKKLYADVDPSRFQTGATAEAMRANQKDWRTVMDAVLRPRMGRDGKEDVEVAKLLDANPPGFIVLAAKDAKVHLAPDGKLRYEPQPQKNTLGYWVNAADSASWDFEVKLPGIYAIYVLQGCGGGGAEVGIEVEREPGTKSGSITFKVQNTGHFQNFVSREIGNLKLEAGNQTLFVRPKSKPGAAVMDLRRVTLVRVE